MVVVEHLRKPWSFSWPYARSTNHSFSERKRRPTGISQFCARRQHITHRSAALRDRA